LTTKKQITKKKPNFIRQDSNKYNFQSGWRKPRGLQSKLRLRKKGHSKIPKVGYGSPKATKGLDKFNLMPVLISNIKEIKSINRDSNSIILSSKMGNKSKIKILEECKKLNIQILNVKNMDELITKIKETKEKQKKESKQKEAKKKKAEEEAKKKAEKVKAKKTEEEKKIEETKEKKESLKAEQKQIKQPKIAKEIKPKGNIQQQKIIPGSK